MPVLHSGIPKWDSSGAPSPNAGFHPRTAPYIVQPRSRTVETRKSDRTAQPDPKKLNHQSPRKSNHVRRSPTPRAGTARNQAAQPKQEPIKQTATITCKATVAPSIRRNAKTVEPRIEISCHPIPNRENRNQTQAAPECQNNSLTQKV